MTRQTARRRRRSSLNDLVLAADRDSLVAAGDVPDVPVYATWTALVAIDNYVAETPQMVRRLSEIEYVGGRNALYSKLTNSAEPHLGPATGHVETVMKLDGQTFAEGVFYDTDEGRMAAALAQNGTFAGVSMDGEVESEFTEDFVENEDGSMTLVVDFQRFLWGELTQVSRPAIEQAGFIDVSLVEAGQTLPGLIASGGDDQGSDDGFLAKLASVSFITAGGEVDLPTYDFDAFHLPEAPHPMLPTVFENGFWAGHLATWGTCHVAYQDRCITPPKSASGYEIFHQSPALFSNGERGRVGKFTTGVGHAPAGLRPQATVEHYDHAGQNAAFGRVLDGEIGIWACGVIDPTATPDGVHQFATSAQSGDWRRVNRSLELFASLAVNYPGFPIPSPTQFSRKGEVVTLQAAGVIEDDHVREVQQLYGNMIGLGVDVGSLRPSANLDFEARQLIADEMARQLGLPTYAEAKMEHARRLAASVGLA